MLSVVSNAFGAPASDLVSSLPEFGDLSGLPFKVTHPLAPLCENTAARTDPIRTAGRSTAAT